MNSFEQLVQSRKAWIDSQLKPWCLHAGRSDLLKAEPEWNDIAGKVDPEKTLWKWAWSRFPDLVHDDLGIDESSPLSIRLRDGQEFAGYPDSRKSLRGQLMIWGTSGITPTGRNEEFGPFSIDEIETVTRIVEYVE